MSPRGVLLGFLILPVAAGCLEPEEDAPASPHFFLDIEPGMWRAFAPQADGGYSLHLDEEQEFPSYDVSDQDSYACTAATGPGGWARWGGTSRNAGLSYLGTRSSAGSAWLATSYVHTRDGSGLMVLGNGADDRYLLAHDRVGPVVDSSVAVTEGPPTSSELDSGRFWCLDGVSRYAGGAYTVTQSMVDAGGLSWQEDFDDGILVRAQADVDHASVSLVGPDDSSYDLTGASFDKTFCSDEAGAWTLMVEELSSDAPRPWTFSIWAFDAASGLVPCAASWQHSPFMTDNVDWL